MMNTQTTENILCPEKWAQRYSKKMIYYTFLRVGDIENAEDIVQDAFLSALGSSHKYKGQANEKTWLYSILKHHIVDFYRIKGRNTISNYTSLTRSEDVCTSSWVENIPLQDKSYDSDNELLREEFAHRLEEALSQLPDKQASVFRMKAIEEVDTEQICQALDITSANYWVLMHRARIYLREYFGM